MKKISRRKFLRLTALSLGSLVGSQVIAACSPTQPAAAPADPPAAPATTAPAATETILLPTATQPPEAIPQDVRPLKVGSSVVSVVQSNRASVQDMSYADIKDLVKQAVDLSGGLGDILKDGQTVVLKPNIYGRVYAVNDQPMQPEANGLVTDWRVTKAVVELVRQINPSGKVYIMDGSALGNTAENMAALKYTPLDIPGVDAFLAIESDSGAWQDTSSPGLVKVDLPDGLWQTSYYLNRKYKEADVVISLPVLKNHSYAAVTGAIKNVAIGATPANIYGNSQDNINRFNKIPHDRINFHKWVHDYYRCRPVEFVVMDGLQGVQNGPMCYAELCDLTSNQLNMRLILAGRDPLAVDTIQSLLMGWDPETVEYLRLLNASQAGNLDTAHITVLGQPVDRVRKDFAGPAPSCGGKKVTAKTPPEVAIVNASLTSGKLDLTLSADEKTNKVEVWIDDQLLLTNPGPVLPAGSLDVSRFQAGAHELKVCGYDRFLNRTEQIQKIEL